jgi:hypothetical protein
MTSFFPDLNVWLALSVAGHAHNAASRKWLDMVPRQADLVFARFTQIGLLRLLTNESVMGQQTLTLRKAWSVYDRWLNDPRVEFCHEPRDLEVEFRQATTPFAGKAASKWVGDCYMLAYANATNSTLVTFDRALFHLARKQRCPAVIPN